MRRMRAALLLLTCAACSTVRPAWSIAQPLEATRRLTTEGEVIGGAAHYGGYAWLGIPFAAPPTGPLRWRPPQPPAPRAQPLLATHSGHACIQPPSFLTVNEPVHDGVLGDEDCLTLNVFAPPEARDLPVMVWIHGGGNSIGSAASFDVSNLATKQKLVVIAVQYRLGPLGWLSHPALHATDDVSGNFGTLDLVRALEWVRDNAAAFGGDPHNVTVFGESAGGTNVYSLLLSPYAKGLFHRAIAQSPFLSRITVEAARDGHPNASNEVLRRLLARREPVRALETLSLPEVEALLRSLTPGELVKLYLDGAPLIGGQLDMPMLFPDGAVLPARTWFESFAREDGWNRVPVITGTNHDEAKLFQVFDPHYTSMLFGFLPRIRDEVAYEATASEITRLWRGWCVDAVAQAMHRSGHDAVWSYRFDWAHQPPLLGTDVAKVLGAGHGVEIAFVHGDFDGEGGQLTGGPVSPERDTLSAQMMARWAAFARDGQPGAGWQPYAGNAAFLVFDTPLQKVTMQAGADDPERALGELLEDPHTGPQQKCEGLAKLRGMGFIPAEQSAGDRLRCEALKK